MNSTQQFECRNANETIWAWYLLERDHEWPSKPVVDALQWYAKNDPIPDFGYTGDWKANLEYASDRMNGGRAKAILRLMKEAGHEA